MKATVLVLAVALAAVVVVPAPTQAHAVTCAMEEAECIAMCLVHVAENETNGDPGHACAIQ